MSGCVASGRSHVSTNSSGVELPALCPSLANQAPPPAGPAAARQVPRPTPESGICRAGMAIGKLATSVPASRSIAGCAAAALRPACLRVGAPRPAPPRPAPRVCSVRSHPTPGARPRGGAAGSARRPRPAPLPALGGEAPRPYWCQFFCAHPLISVGWSATPDRVWDSYPLVASTS